MEWKPLTLHFRQRYDGGYRYLDRCGAFILAAEDALAMIPSDTQLSGTKLELPEIGVSATVDVKELRVVQEVPGDGDPEFLSICCSLATLVGEHFGPSVIQSNGFARRSYWAMASGEAAMEGSLRFGGERQTDLSRAVGMVPSHMQLYQAFTSGSRELIVQVAPITFEKVTVQRQNPPLRSSARQRNTASRYNRKADRVGTTPSHAVTLNVDVVEYEPPPGKLSEHFAELMRCDEILRRELNP